MSSSDCCVLRMFFSLVAASGLLAACNAPLPEPESPGARVYAERCNTCHRLYAPSSLKYELWKMKVEAMQGEMVRRGIPPLSTSEREVLLEYLRKHGG